ncbi:MAG TPA: type I glyceraldehyde-3-phosphate dehydrogenase [Actinomycetota bacterium]|jgi:glyceraldehyde 3-phosphate dehydrogenase|nr:type I glyceraldehyde-3-phosphate dehydrogenase [Actinomycetota bacterium]
MTVRVGINGFGRIGRSFFRAILAQGEGDVELVAVNDPFGDPEVMAHLLKYDSVGGVLPHDVKTTDDGFAVDGQSVRKLENREPAQTPWGDLGVQIVLESTGLFTAREKASAHLQGGAKKVVISAPSGDADAMLVLGVNQDSYDPASHHVVSNASCTTNCLAPMARVLHDAFGIERGFMLTVHAYTSDQALVDVAQVTRSGKPDLRRMRAAALNVIPNTTGAAKAIGAVIPELDGKLDGMALRVPVPDGSITDLTAVVSKDVSKDDVNAAFRDAAGSARYQRILEFTDKPLVSQDIVGNPHSCVFSSLETMVNGNAVKILGWYDNEWGYSNRLVDLCRFLDRAGL